MIQRIQVTILFIVIVFGALYLYAKQQNASPFDFSLFSNPVVHVGDIPIKVEVADSPRELEIGLSGRDSLPATGGMLFIFPEEDYHGIWMKNMRFPIDVIWVDESYTVVGITERLMPESYPKVFEPPVPARYVIETNVDFSRSYGIKVGDTVRIPNKFLR